jgi:membrane dipeptidase
MQPYIDLHCDTLTMADGFEHTQWRLGGCSAQVFAIYLPQNPTMDDMTFIEQAVAKYHAEFVPKLDEINCKGILALEDGRVIDGADTLRRLYDLGIRMVTLAWNNANGLAGERLTAHGHDMVSAMEQLGIIVDISHLTDGAFWDVAQTARKPFIASHSNARALCSHKRNLTDDMIKAIAESGGVIGVNFVPFFIEDNAKTVSLEQIIHHIKHIMDIGGESVISIGSDFHGDDSVYAIKDPSAMQSLFGCMKRNGFTDNQIERFAYKNAEAIFI